MLATLLLELGLPDAPHSDCGRWKAAFPRAVAEVFGRNGLEFENVRPMGSLRRLAFLVEGIPTSVGAHRTWVDGPLVRVGRAPDGHFTPVAMQFAERFGKSPSELEVKERDGVQRFGATVSRAAALTASVLPTLLPELLDRLAASDRNSAVRGMALNDALQWIVALFGDSRVRFRWANVQSDRYTYKSSNKTERIAVPHFYEYHATLAQAGIRVDEATRKEHIVRQLNAAATDFGGTCVITERQLEQLSQRLDRPFVHLRRGMPQELHAGFVEALARASVGCVPVKRDGALAPGWLVVSEEGDQVSRDAADAGTRAFEQCLPDAASWLKSRETAAQRRDFEAQVTTFLETMGASIKPLPKEREALLRALWLSRYAERTLTYNCFPGVELYLALQRALHPKVAPPVSAILESLCERLSPAPEPPPTRSPSEQRLAQKAFIVLAFARLTEGFAHHQAPLGDRDPLGLRVLADRLFEVLVMGEWPVPMLRASRLAHLAFCGREGDKDAQVWDDEGALAAFLRHRFRRFVERVEPGLAKPVPPAGEWSVLEVWKQRAVDRAPKARARRSGSPRQR